MKVKEKLYSCNELVYKGDGIICIQDDKFEGYIALDYIIGYYEGNMLQMDLFRHDLYNESIYNKFQTIVEAFELPNDFCLDNADGLAATLEIVRVKQVNIQSFKDRVKNVAKIHGF